ncbi:MAG: hypothetical protein ABI859_07505 [Pseudomonadota bacterium]
MNDKCHDCADSGLSLSTCDVTRCEAMCCYDGAYVEPQEEAFLRELVARVPALAECVPQEFIVEGYWFGEHLGRKTATRPHQYASAHYPAHFAKTRCVFADGQGFCELEKLARSRGQHPWTFKPAVCWLFPLQEVEGESQPELPPVDPLDDEQRQEGYPGYATVVHCGRHDPQGKPWRDALTGELAYLAQAKRLPILGSPGNTVDELLAEQRR